MKKIRLFTIGILLGVICSSQAQTHTPPTTKMSHPVYKSFLDSFMDYPANALKLNEQGTVKIEFTTDPTGAILNRSIKTSVSHSIDSTALSIFDLIIWNPGQISGQDVKSTGIYSLDFKKKKFMHLAKKRGYLHTPKNYTPFDSSGVIFLLKKTEQTPVFFLNNSTTSLSQYIYNNLTYPANANKLGISGDVKLSFVVELNGIPSNIVAESYIGGGCTEEAIRLLEGTRWKPGIKDGKYVRTHHTMVITFEKGEHRGKHIPNQSNTGI